MARVILSTTHQDGFTELTIPASRTHGIAERGLDHRESGLRQCSLAIESLIDPRVFRVIDGAKLLMLDQRSDTFFSEVLA